MTEQPQNSAKSFISQILQPRMLLYIWGGLGALALLWVGVAAMIPQGKPGAANVDAGTLLVGEMAGFELTFPQRGAPYTQFQGPNGATSLQDFSGKVVLVNFWATFCPPCVEELPSLDRLQRELSGEKFEVVAVAAEPRMDKRGPEFLDRHGIESLALYMDAQLDLATTVAGGSVTLPLTILYDSRGNEIGRLSGGANWDSPEAKKLIQAVIDGQKIG